MQTKTPFGKRKHDSRDLGILIVTATQGLLPKKNSKNFGRGQASRFIRRSSLQAIENVEAVEKAGERPVQGKGNIAVAPVRYQVFFRDRPGSMLVQVGGRSNSDQANVHSKYTSWRVGYLSLTHHLAVSSLTT